jgi:hypothetical protein
VLAGAGLPDPYGMISQEGLSHYLPGFNDKKRRYVDIKADGITNRASPGAEDLVLDGVWSCPSHNLNTLDDTISRLNETKNYFRTHKAYFGRAEYWDNLATNPDDFGRKDIGSRHVIMADSLFYWSGSDFWIYNHGKFGASDHNLAQTFAQPIEVMTGINKLYGDGHVDWKTKSEFDPALFTNPTVAGPRINNGYGGYTYY